ncbi:Uu.00g113750.m01.CDS01 [Anthostomella pinea]|uniref:Ribosomal RNA-processing protein 43 n=1 Tax=Anthostomella pinea TaxID=933095 RepID=A0AAI8VG18_9PEZI|nr:Uu.00g113750.m01.CDS01 [Anthostomella pinea]
MATTQSPLTLSSATFAKLSPHPYLLANLQPPDASTPSSRTNGRQPRQARQPNINTSSLSHAHGSAVVRTGDTTVICGVRGETLLTTDIPNYRAPDVVNPTKSDAVAEADELRDYDLLVPNIELATGCAPNFLPGVPPTTLAQTLSTRLYSLLHSSGLVDVEDLRIYHDRPEKQVPRHGDKMEEVDADEEEEDTAEVKAYWVLYIDVLFVSFDGNPFDAAWAAVLAALRDTKLPPAVWDPDHEMVLCSRKAPSSLNIRGMPVACTAAVFTAKEKQQRKGEQGQYWILVDPDRFEESLCDEALTVVVDRTLGETKVLGISKSGGTTVGPQLMWKYVTVAEERWQEFKSAL